MSDTFWTQLHITRKLISQRESELADLYVQRAGFIQAMAASKMGQREIGAYWKISQPRVQGILKARGHRSLPVPSDRRGTRRISQTP